MSTYIFTSKKLGQPVFVIYKPRRNSFLLAEGIKLHHELHKWEVQILQNLVHYPHTKKCLIQGIRSTMSTNQLIFVKLKRIFFHRTLCIYFDGTKLRRQCYNPNKITL
ncbi:MAG: hypothetical protein WCQ95_08240 [Bacteroidota bacterium]